MQGGIEIFLKAVRGCLCFIEVKDTAGRVVGRNLGSHCPVPCLPLSRLPSLMQYVSKILVALSNGSKPAAFRGGRQAEERGRGLRQGQLVGAAVAQKERGGKAGCSHLWSPSGSHFQADPPTLPPSFKTAASHCSPLLPEGTGEQKHQQTASLEGFMFPVITCLLIPEVYESWGRGLGNELNMPWEP